MSREKEWMEKLLLCQEKALKLGLAIAVANLNYVSFPVRLGANEGQNTNLPSKEQFSFSLFEQQ